MAWTTPRTWETDEIPPASTFNTHIRDNENYLKSAADSRAVSVEVFSYNVPLAVGDGKRYLGPMPSLMVGYNLTKVTITVYVPSTSGKPTVQVARGRQATPTTAHAWVDTLSTLVTIDVNEYSSLNATVSAVVNTGYDDVAEGDLFRIDLDVTGTGTTGWWVTLEFTK